jgi:hypothetical protein
MTKLIVCFGLALLITVSCSGEANTGKALAMPDGWVTSGFGPIPPGQQVESLDVELQNTSAISLTVVGVRIVGRGVGTVGRVVRMEAAPIPEVDVGTDWVPNGEWVTYPPVAEASPESAICDVQRLVPLRGYVLRPGARIRIAMLLHALAPGVFQFSGVTARYSQNGATRGEYLTNGVRFTVTAHAIPRQVSQLEQPCLSRTTILPTGSPVGP